MPVPTIPPQPLDFAMLATARTIFTFGDVAPLAIIGIMAPRYRRRNRTAIPMLLLLGGLLCVAIEPIVDVLGLCYFPDQGSSNLFRAFDVPIPLFMTPVYMWYVGGQAFLIFDGALETPGLLMGVYTYYGAQPFSPPPFPWWWTFCNALMPMTVAILIFHLRQDLVGARCLLLIPLVLMADGMMDGAIGWPTWLAPDSGLGYSATYPAATLSLGLVCVAIYVLTRRLPQRHGESIGQAAFASWAGKNA